MITESQGRRSVLILFVCAVAARLAAGLPRGADASLRDGYGFYTTISYSFLSGNGLCYSPEGGCADRTPLYPLWLAPFLASGTIYPGLIIAQAIIGALLTWIAWQLGTLLFDRRVGLLAAAAAAFSPYAVVHDTALQDTVFINVLVALAMVLLLRAQGTGPALAWFGAGLALSLAVLTNARIALFVPCALAWIVFAGGGSWSARLRSAALVAVPVLMLVGGWMLRNWQVAGAPVLTTESGKLLWMANNPATFNYFPERSIDLTVNDSGHHLSPEMRAMLQEFPGNDAQRDAFVRRWAIEYMIDDPQRTAIGAARKIWVAISAQFSPARGAAIQWGYAAAFLPVHALAAWTLVRTRRHAGRHGLAWGLLVSFLATTALYWAHTSHKSYLDAVLFTYAAAALTSWLPTRSAAVPA